MGKSEMAEAGTEPCPHHGGNEGKQSSQAEVGTTLICSPTADLETQKFYLKLEKNIICRYQSLAGGA